MCIKAVPRAAQRASAPSPKRRSICTCNIETLNPFLKAGMSGCDSRRSWGVGGVGGGGGRERKEQRGEGRGERGEKRGERGEQSSDHRRTRSSECQNRPGGRVRRNAAECGRVRQNAAESGAERQEHRCGNDDDSLDFLANESVTSQTPRDLRPRLRVQPLNQTQICWVR